MPDLSGTLQSVELDATLWLVPVLPLLASLVLALWGRALTRDKTLGAAPSERVVGYLGWGGAAAAVVVLSYAGARLAASSASQRMLLSSPLSLLRIGSLDVTASFVLSPAIALVALAVALVGTALAWRVSQDADAKAPELATRLAWIELGVGGSLLAVMADDVVLVLMGWGAIAVVVALGSRAAMVRARFAALAALFGVGLLFWSLGGEWIGSGDYVPDFRARLVAVHPPDATPRAHGDETEPTGFLTLSALTGSRVRVGGVYLCAVGDDGKPGGVSLAGHACRVYARSPFVRIPVAAAIQDITVETGPGSYDLTVEKVRLVRGVETTLALTGPTLSPRLARDQLSLRDETGAYVVQGELSKRKLWGLPVLALVGALLLLAAIAKSVRTAKDELSPLGVSALGVVAAAVLAERLSFLAGLSTAASVVLALGGGVFALWMAARAAHAEKLNAALFQIAAAQLGVVLIGLSAESDSLALLHVAVTSLSLGAIALLAHGVPGELEAAAGKGARSRARAAQVAAAVATGAPLPLVGIVWARDAMGRAVFATEGGPVPTWVPYVLMMLTATVAAFATWRVVLIVWPAPDQQKKTDKGDAVASIGMALAGVAGAMGLLGISGPIVAGKASVIATTPLMAEASPMVHSVGMALTAIALGCSLVGWILARQRYRGEWQKREARRPGHGLLSRESFGPVPLAAVAEAAGAAVVQLTRALGGMDAAEREREPEPPSDTDATPERSVKRPRKEKKRGKK